MKNIQLAAMLLLTIFASCKKEALTDPVDPTTPVAQKKLTGYTYQGIDSNPVKIEYDSQGRIVLFDDGEDATTMLYSGNAVQFIEKRKSENDREVFNVTCKLDSKGRIIEANGTSAYTLPARQVKYTFEYNSDGYMTRKIQNYNDGASVYDFHYTYKDGNLASFEAFLNGAYDYSGAWEYDKNTTDHNGLNWDQFIPCPGCTGKTNKNLPVKYTSYRDGKVSWYADYAYTFDAQGYPLTNAIAISNGTAYTLVYQYN